MAPPSRLRCIEAPQRNRCAGRAASVSERATFAARVGVESTLSARYRFRRGQPYRVAAAEQGSTLQTGFVIKLPFPRVLKHSEIMYTNPVVYSRHEWHCALLSIC